MPTRVDIDVWIGNSLPPVEWKWPDGFVASPLCELSVWLDGTRIITAGLGSGLIVDTVGRRFLWDRTIEQSRLIPLGRLAQYELEDQLGGEATAFYGTVVGRGGRNRDVGAPEGDGSLNFSNPYNSGLWTLGWI